MVVQLGNVLVIAAVGHEAVAAFVEVEFLHEALHGSVEIDEEIGVGWLEAHQAANLAFGHDEDV